VRPQPPPPPKARSWPWPWSWSGPSPRASPLAVACDPLRRTVERALPLPPRWRGALAGSETDPQARNGRLGEKEISSGRLEIPEKKNKKIGEGIPKHQKYVRRVCVCEAVFLARSVVVPHTRRVVEDL